MIQISNIDQIAVIEFDYGKVNALDLEFCRSVNAALNRLVEDSFEGGAGNGAVAKGLVIGTARSVFSAGIDLKRFLAEDKGYITPFLEEMERLFRNILTCPMPVVADISGPAIAGGCMIAAAGDFRVIAQDAKMGILESRLGVALPMTAIELMRHVATPTAFKKIISTGATFVGQQAVESGLADAVGTSGDTREMAIQAALQLIELPQNAFRFTKQQRLGPVLRNIEENKKQLYDEYLKIWCSQETRHAVQNYVDKRLS
ncbi:MAG: enoyl-CoA hydratase/isomerase family protein [Planctomycetota bacterium]